MDYNDFMKSKHIAERWGEFQANYKNLNKTSELKAYHDLLTEFYDYIQKAAKTNLLWKVPNKGRNPKYLEA